MRKNETFFEWWRGTAGAMECDLGSLVRRDPEQHRVLRWFLFCAVRGYFPRFVRGVLAVMLYDLLHPRGVVGRWFGRKMSMGLALDPWGESYIPAARVRRDKEAARRAGGRIWFI